MRDYAILVRERGPERLPDIAVVPYGFSWSAFLFQALWALYRGVWLTALILLTVGLVVSALCKLVGLDPLSSSAVEIAAALCLSLVAEDLRRFELVRRRYRLVDIVAASSLARAEAAGIRALVDQAGEQTPPTTEISHSQGLQSPALGSI